MPEQQIKDRITKLRYELAATQVQGFAIGVAGGIAGVYLANKHKKKFWGKVGYFIAGEMLATLPLTVLNAKKNADKLAEIKILESQLPAPASQQSLYDQLQSQLSNK